eukprot:CAMPEP_0194049392 /NCGR_PEP_ID=MMETSP0009_2-20130614/30587_1 /TAXON_ID=210454 /ORGANISM="Grammatophora oceanica, Strain CCMP 410" /LENGTH=212 /DNA_ID=CAMNT_0038695539 /DNA_START=47 /DNA_END=685 /DNA_ORIENTATION=-
MANNTRKQGAIFMGNGLKTKRWTFLLVVVAVLSSSFTTTVEASNPIAQQGSTDFVDRKDTITTRNLEDASNHESHLLSDTATVVTGGTIQDQDHDDFKMMGDSGRGQQVGSDQQHRRRLPWGDQIRGSIDRLFSTPVKEWEGSQWLLFLLLLFIVLSCCGCLGGGYRRRRYYYRDNGYGRRYAGSRKVSSSMKVPLGAEDDDKAAERRAAIV